MTGKITSAQAAPAAPVETEAPAETTPEPKKASPKRAAKKAACKKTPAPKAATPKRATKKAAGKKKSAENKSPKSVKKAAGKKTPAAPKAAKKAPATVGAKKVEGLRKPQVRVLEALAKTGKPMTRNQIAEKAPVDVATCVEYLGSHDPEKRAANDKKHFPSLITLGYVKLEVHDINGKDTRVYTITAAGRKAVSSK